MGQSGAVRGGGWSKEAGDLARAASGGMLFGIPLLYTMEVWWIGGYSRPIPMLVALALSLVVVLLLTRTSGFRTTKDVRLSDALMDTVETLALGLLSVGLLLVLLREITMSTPLQEVLGKIVYEATPFSIGIALAHHFLRKGRAEGDEEGGSPGKGISATASDIGATLIGALFIAFNIAPTDEVPMLAAAMGPAWLVGLVAASLTISYLIVFEAGFSDEKRRRTQPGIFQHPVTETVVGYLLALVMALAMLAFFQRTGTTLHQTLSYVIVLGLPAAVGGAAGRLAV